MAFLHSILPGLYLLAIVLSLAWALARYGDPLPARVLAVFGAVLAVLFFRALFMGEVLLPLDILRNTPPFQGLAPPPRAGNPLQMDLVTEVAPWLALVRRALHAGEWPLWNAFAGAGMPLLADPQSQALQPLALVTLPLPLDQAVGVMAALRVLAALVFTFLLLRRQGIGEGPALAGSLAFGLSGFLLLWLGWPLANTAALLPPALYALVMTDERGHRRDFLLLLLALWALLLAGHPETQLYAAGTLAVFAIARLLARREGLARLALRWAGALLIAGGLAAPALLPTLSFLGQTHRNALVTQRNARLKRTVFARGWRTPEEDGALVRRRLVPVVAPYAFGDSRVFWGDLNVNETGTAFAGSATLLLAAAALAPGARRRFPQERLILGLGLASLVMIARPPGTTRFCLAVPGLDRSATMHQRLVMILALCLAYAAACELERWRRGEGRRAVLIAAAVGLAAVVAGAYLGSRPPAGAPDLPELRIFSLAFQLSALAATAALLLWGWRRNGATRLTALVPVLVGAELLCFYAAANPSQPRRLYYPAAAPLTWLQTEARGFRVAGLGGTLLPNIGVVYGLADARVSSPFKPYLYTEALAPVSRSVRDIEDIFVRPEHPLYQLLGVRFLLVPPGAQLGRPLQLVRRDPSLWIFERPSVLPRLFLPGAAEIAGTASWTDWVARNPDFAARALVAPTPQHPEAWSAAEPQGAPRFDPVIEGSTRLRAEFAAPEERLLASSVLQDGGWRLLVDGRPHPTTLANGPFVAAWLPPGSHRVDLLYRPAAFVWGCILAALALAGLAVGSVAPPRS